MIKMNFMEEMERYRKKPYMYISRQKYYMQQNKTIAELKALLGLLLTTGVGHYFFYIIPHLYSTLFILLYVQRYFTE